MFCLGLQSWRRIIRRRKPCDRCRHRGAPACPEAARASDMMETHTKRMKDDPFSPCPSDLTRLRMLQESIQDRCDRLSSRYSSTSTSTTCSTSSTSSSSSSSSSSNEVGKKRMNAVFEDKQVVEASVPLSILQALHVACCGGYQL